MNNIFNYETVSPDTPTVVAGLTVPARGGYSLKGIVIYSDIDCSIQVKLNTTTISGGLITGTIPTLFLDFSASPYGLIAGDVVMVLATQTSDEDHNVSCTILAEQL